MKPEWLEGLEQSLAKHLHIPSSIFAQLATVDLDNRPANRTVVFRSFASEKLVFTTRQDAEKVSQVLNNPWVELCWYFTESREQYRILGKCQVIDVSSVEMQETREHVWQTLSDSSKQTFTWPASGKPLESLESYQKRTPDNLPDQFVLLVLEPRQVDILDLRSTPHQRNIYSLTNKDWVVQAVNP